jgi:hypothetical protein
MATTQIIISGTPSGEDRLGASESSEKSSNQPDEEPLRFGQCLKRAAQGLEEEKTNAMRQPMNRVTDDRRMETHDGIEEFRSSKTLESKLSSSKRRNPEFIEK